MSRVNLRKHTNLLVGFFAVSAVIIVIMTITLLLNVQGIFNPEYQLHAVFENGIGLRKGTAVLFNGVKVGSVDKIDLLQGNGINEGSSKVSLTLNIDEKFKPFITDRTIAYVMRDKNLVSDRVINLESPAWSSNALDFGDTIMVTPTRDIETVLSSLNNLMEKVDELLTEVDTVIYRVSDPSSTIGAMLGSRELYDQALRDMQEVNRTIETGNRLLGKVTQMSDDVEEILPGILSSADTTFKSISRTAVDMERMMARMDRLLENADGVMGKVERFIEEGSGSLEEADDLIDAVSDFWFIRGKIKKQRSKDFPLMANGIGL